VRDRDMVTVLMRRFTHLLLSVAVLVLAGGCKSWLDQSELARHEGDRLLVPILSELDPIDEVRAEFPDAEDVRPGDLEVVITDYVISRNDVLLIGVFDLVGIGELTRQSRVSETGMLALPLLQDPIKASGLTEQQLRTAIAQKYKEAGVLEDAQVSVTVVEARGRTFWISGSVGRDGQWPIPEANLRLMQALAQAGGISPFVKNVYVIRQRSSETPSTQPSQQQPEQKPKAPDVDILAPQGTAAPALRPMLAMQEAVGGGETTPGTGAGIDEREITVGGERRTIGQIKPPATAPAAEEQMPPPQPPYEFGASLAAQGEQRVIRIPYERLLAGDLRYNIVIRPNDLIVVPPITSQIYYMGGHVRAPGPYSLTGQKINLKQAVIGAGMLDPLAVPSKTDIIRRDANNNELWVRVDLRKIFEGRQPDVYLKPNDMVIVGTDAYPIFLAAFRNAFRVTYGFGFLYDRNFAND